MAPAGVHVEDDDEGSPVGRTILHIACRSVVHPSLSSRRWGSEGNCCRCCREAMPGLDEVVPGSVVGYSWFAYTRDRF